LRQNQPNPFNPSTRIQFTLAQDDHVQLQVLDLAGRRVRTLLLEPRSAGLHEVVWDGRDALGRRVASGVYLYRITTPTFAATRKLTMVQ
jgi:flagellar hook assembly protein FlgD